MATFTVHVPPNIPDAAKRADRTIFIREGFSVPAFLFGPVFLLYRRLWIAALGWCVVAVLLGLLVHLLQLPRSSEALLFLLLALMTGLEAGTARRAALGRQGYIFAALLTALTRDAAEIAFFRGEGTRPPVARPSGASRMPDDEVIGLFPHAGNGT